MIFKRLFILTALYACAWMPLRAEAPDSRLREIYAAQQLTVVKPIETDSTDTNNKRFSDERLLKLKVHIPEQSAFTEKFTADTAGFFHLAATSPKNVQGNAYVQLFSFYVSADSYGKAEIKATSPDRLEIYVDGKLEASKTSVEGSPQAAKDATAEIAPYPNACRVVVKLLHTSDTVDAALQITVEDIAGGKKSKRNENTNPNRLHVSTVPQRRMTLDDAIKGKRTTDISVSPSGKYIVITYSDNYGATSTSSKELYVARTGKRIALDSRKQPLAWTPATDFLYYIRKDGDVSNLVTINPETLEEKTIARDVPEEYFTIAPDEKSLYYSKTEKRSEEKSDVFRMHTLTNRSGGKPSVSYIYNYDLQAGIARQLTFGSHATYLNDISRDGKKILFSISDETITERPFHKSSMFMLNVETMQTDTIWQNEKYASRAMFSPDGKQILATGGPEAFGGIGLNVSDGMIANSYDTQAFLIDLQTKRITPFTKDFAPSIKSVEWSVADKLIYMLTADEDRAPIYTYNPETRQFTRLPSQEDVINGFRLADGSPTMVYTGVSASNSTRAYLYDIKTKKSSLLADPYAEQLSQLTLGEVKDFNFTNSDGTEIKGYYYLPPGFDPSDGKKYPMIVNYYGGTTPTERIFESRYPKHVYAALGYVVYVLQPSGAIGFGQEFSALHVNTWGKRSSDDIIEGTEKFLAAHPFVDPKKIGCIGASYGGFMTMYLQTRTDLFAAAVSHAGISSISSYWGEGYWGYSYSGAASADSYPWNNIDLYIGQSPLFSADKINTPLLLLHGSSDTNVPVGESIQMYTALKILGKTAELIQVKGEDHHILTYEKRMLWNNTIFAWFDRWLKGEQGWWKALYEQQ